jgi:dTDP-4-amino-4,6-dideoxygalactose transaminase
MDIDYYHEYPITEDIKRVVLEVLQARVHYYGKYTDGLEAGIARLSGVGYGVAVNSGTSALLVTLAALGVGRGDEVIVPANGYVAVAECPIHLGARSVCADCTPGTMCLDPAGVEAAVTPNTKAVIVIHQHGHPADLDDILAVARRHNLKVIENGCHALGARYKGRPIGSFGDAAFFALSRKLLSVCGTGGVMVTNDPQVADRARRLRHHGWPGYRDYEMTTLGYNFRMNEIQAAIGYMQLESLPSWFVRRRENADLYTREFGRLDVPVRPPVEEPHVNRVFLHYVVRVPGRRNDLLKFLHSHGVEAKVHYSIPIHRQPPIVHAVGAQGPFPVAEQVCDEILSLPCHPGVSDANVKFTAATVGRFFGH